MPDPGRRCKLRMEARTDRNDAANMTNLRLTWLTNWTSLDAMKTVNVHEAKTNFSSLLAKLEKDSESIIICRNGVPVADLVPNRRTNQITAHPVLSKIIIRYDPVESLSVDEWPEG
jgi:antitoxin (DNA-binding transcriptional repressor) of toxin-antitoxin stability system